MNLLGEARVDDADSVEFVRSLVLRPETIADLSTAGLQALVKWVGIDAVPTLEAIWGSDPNRYKIALRSEAIVQLGRLGVTDHVAEVSELLEDATKRGVHTRRRTETVALSGYLRELDHRR